MSSDTDSLGEVLDDLAAGFAAGNPSPSDVMNVHDLMEWLAEDPDMDPDTRARLEAVVPGWAGQLLARGWLIRARARQPQLAPPVRRAYQQFRAVGPGAHPPVRYT